MCHLDLKARVQDGRMTHLPTGRSVLPRSRSAARVLGFCTNCWQSERQLFMTKLFFFATAMLVLLVNAQGASDWPAYRGSRGDGISPEQSPAAWPSGGLKQLWKTETPGGLSSFSVAGGKAFTVIPRMADGALQETCIALDAANGKELWAARTGLAKYDGGAESGAEGNRGGDGPRSTPAFSDGRIFVYSADMVVTCLDAADGKPVWKHNILAEFNGKAIGWQSAMSPAVDGGRVYIAGGGPEQSMLAFDKATGVLAWKSGTEKMTHATPVATTLHGVRQIIYMMQSGLVSVEAASGKPLWNFPFPYRTSTACCPIVAGDTVFCTAGYDIGAAACQVALADGTWTAKEIWRVKGNNPLGDLWSPPVQKDGFLYGMISFKKFAKGPLKCVDLKTGAVKWEQPGFGTGNVILAGDRLIALADDGQLVLVEATPDAYKELSRFKAVSGKCWSTPALSNGRIYVRSTKEGACFELPAK
jgi:outer membrane protein assembly factor BamB